MDGMKLNEGSCKHHMIGGEGPDSYAHNSEYQKQLLLSAEDLIQELIHKHLDTRKALFHPPNTFRIADFGCSIGPNTFFPVENIISAVEKKYKSNCQTRPDFHMFFNDLQGNDFNTLFKTLPSTRKYFAAAAPGSFHGRLFPESTLHLAHCATALHWLSRIPEQVTVGSSKAWNKGRIHYSGAGKEVKKAYLAQYKEDMESFLSARGSELVCGGLMVLVILGFPDGVLLSESSMGLTFIMLGSCLKDMANMGKFSEEKVDSFNLPFYYTSPSELKGIIEENGMFRIETITELPAALRHVDARVITSHLRAVIGALIEEHFGNGVVDELFKRHLEKLVDSPTLVDEKYWKETNYFVFLKKKATA